MIQLLLGALTALVVAILVWPLLRRARAVPTRAAFDMEIYRDQLAEIARDQERGTVTPEEARAARAEIGRRMLALADEAPASAPAGGGRTRFVAVALAVAIPVAALAVYGRFGSPALPGMPLAERRAVEPSGGMPDRQLAAFARAMLERVERNPQDLEAWVRLAQASAAMNLPEQALNAWRRADAISGGQPEIAGLLGETAVAVANGQVTPEAEAAFARVLSADPGDPRARYYAGLAHAQAGERADAVRIWFDLIAASPPDSPWLATVREAMERTAREARIDTRQMRASAKNPPAVVRLGSPRVGSSDADPLTTLPEADRMAAIRGMVDGLAARLETQPDDLDGWRRLARSRKVLGEPDKALAAHARAAAIAPDNIEVLTDYAGALLDLHDSDRPLDPAARAAMANLLAKSPNEGVALWLLGQDEALAGKDMAATALWQRLLGLLPADSPARADLAARIAKLKGGN
ncbi:MAG: c-type cytochrome biogenesis protein CcmI [Rhodospirillales bacterium]|nr:c-type cytochrome biogenesis protein CcmI [Rhodospirillales bacterium]